MTVTDQSMAALNSDVASAATTPRAQHEFTRITILYQKVVTLGTEAEQCIGEDVSYVGATRVDVEIDPSIPDDGSDPTRPSRAGRDAPAGGFTVRLIMDEERTPRFAGIPGDTRIRY